MRKINKKKTIKDKREPFFDLGDIAPDKSRILFLILAIIFVATILIMSGVAFPEKNSEVKTYSYAAPVMKARTTPLEKEIEDMVQGYPIELMMPYISKQDPKVAAFLIAIAKKESAWGKRKPILDGKDCYNYWGFRLKTERMGSGGHTCFDSPEEAVNVIAGRIDQLVNEEKLDTPRDLIVWKCGYGCQEKSKTLEEKKWIKDVDMYYSRLEDYL